MQLDQRPTAGTSDDGSRDHGLSSGHRHATSREIPTIDRSPVNRADQTDAVRITRFLRTAAQRPSRPSDAATPSPFVLFLA